MEQSTLPTLHVFSGPTLEPSAIIASAPNARIHPPIKHGDLFDPRILPGDRVLIIDGLYHHTASIRHKEIIDALARDIDVVGTASLGALRAADLHTLGMRGVGTVFAHYRDGVVTDDSEVAVAHSATGDQSSLTMALVNFRHMLDLAAAAGVVEPCDAVAARNAVAEIYYPERTFSRVTTELATLGQEVFADWLTAQRAANQFFGDLKRDDALAALSFCALPGTGRFDETTWSTGFFRDWRNHFAAPSNGSPLPPLHRLRYQQLFNPHFPLVWRQFLEASSQHPPDNTTGMPLTERVAALVRDTTVDPALLFLPRFDLSNRDHWQVLLGAESDIDRENARVYAHATTELAAEAGVDPKLLTRDAARTLLKALWRTTVDNLDIEYRRRGIRSEREAIAALSLFVIGYLRAVAAAHREATVDS